MNCSPRRRKCCGRRSYFFGDPPPVCTGGAVTAAAATTRAGAAVGGAGGLGGSGRRKTHVASTRLPVFVSVPQTTARWYFDLIVLMPSRTARLIAPFFASYEYGTIEPRERRAMPTLFGSRFW